MTAFSTLNVLPPAQLTNLNGLGYLTMTPVQAAALPAILAGKDVRVQAKTGSGKTAAFGLGLLQQIDASLFQTQALVLCPTRELADQVAGELRRLARFLPNTKIGCDAGRVLSASIRVARYACVSGAILVISLQPHSAVTHPTDFHLLLAASPLVVVGSLRDQTPDPPR